MDKDSITVAKILEAAGADKLDVLLENIYNSSPLGPVDSNLGNTIFGVNHRQTPLALPINKDQFGLTFFTRPNLNMTTSNLRQVRQLGPLLNVQDRSIQRIIRCTLDPNLAFGTDSIGGRITSPYVDPNQMFIPMLSNLCLSTSGWPDMAVDTRTTPEGHYRENHSMADSSILVRNTYEINANFRNISGNPITLLFLFWIMYQSFVFEGLIVPYGEYLMQNEIDYNTRIYRLTLDSSKRYVQNIIACGAAFPLNAPIGAIGNYDSTQPFNTTNDQVTIRFQTTGMDFNDPISLHEFNQAGCIFNTEMRDGARERTYIKLPYNTLSFFNMRGYPRIEPKTMELEWWISRSVYNRYAAQIAAYSDMTRANTYIQQINNQLI